MDDLFANNPRSISLITNQSIVTTHLLDFYCFMQVGVLVYDPHDFQ